MIFHANSNKKTVEVAILIAERMDFKTNIYLRDKKYHIKGSIYQEDIAIIHINITTEPQNI